MQDFRGDQVGLLVLVALKNVENDDMVPHKQSISARPLERHTLLGLETCERLENAQPVPSKEGR
jgi:hypothetical protein